MRIIIPMAGMGKRMRPHTLTVPKPLFPIAGKPIVQRLAEDIVKVCDEKIEEIAYIIGDFGKEVEEKLISIAENLGAKGSIYYQEEALGTAHAILCAKESLKGNVIVAFADTLFKADFKLDTSQDGIVWVHKVENPSSFGVVKLDEQNVITDFVEKPDTFVSDLAIIGIYYFKDGKYLSEELQYLIDNNIKDKGEFQLTNALENMKNKGSAFITGSVIEWLDCGNKDATVYTNQRILEFNKNSELTNKTAAIDNSVIIQPCFIGPDVELKNSIVGPHVSIGENTKLENTVIKNSIVLEHSNVNNISAENSIIGNHVEINSKFKEYNIGDYCTLSE